MHMARTLFIPCRFNAIRAFGVLIPGIAHHSASILTSAFDFLMIREQMKERTRFCLLALLVLCVLTLLVGGRLRGDADSWFRNAPAAVGMISAILLFYGYVLLRKPNRGNQRVNSFMDAGFKWGLAAGCLWLVGLLVEPAVWFLALVLPLLAGAISAVSTGRLRDGMQTGLWCGIAGGMLGFLVFATEANIALIFPTLFPKVDPDELVFALWMLIAYGPIYCPVAATIGGLVGIPLARTGKPFVSRPVSS
jgi:hypothetical protein